MPLQIETSTLRRRDQMHMDFKKYGIDATEISPRLYQGSMPQPGDDLKRCGFDLLVLAAQEYQPEERMFHGVRVLHAPMDDATLSSGEWIQAVRVARQVAQAVRRGKTVLVTCAQGRNRSGLIVAVTLHLLTGESGGRIIRGIQARRRNALTNESFVRRLEQLRSATLRT